MVVPARGAIQGGVIVADGHGDLGACSAQAARLFIDALSAALEAPYDGDAGLRSLLRDVVAMTDAALCAILDQSVDQIVEEIQHNPLARLLLTGPQGLQVLRERLGSGTTFLAALALDGRWCVVHVGDCCLCRLRPGAEAFERVTTDHSWTLDDEGAEQHGRTIYKHNLAVARALGHPELKRAELLPSHPDVHFIDDVEPGEVWAMCSDGVKLFAERDGEGYPAEHFTQEALDACTADVMEVARAESEDNFSLALLRFRSADAPAEIASVHVATQAEDDASADVDSADDAADDAPTETSETSETPADD